MDTILIFLLTLLDHPAAIHAILFSILLFSGIGIGLLPEEVTLILGGYVAYLGFIRFSTVLVVLTLGIFAADMTGYFVGLWYGAWIEEHIVARWGFAQRMVEKVKKLFERHGEKMVMFSRPFFAVRVAVPIFAGHARMKFSTFFLYDALVSIPWTVLLVSASYYLSATLDVFAEARQIKHYIFLGVILAAMGYTALRLIKGIFTRA